MSVVSFPTRPGMAPQATPDPEPDDLAPARGILIAAAISVLIYAGFLLWAAAFF